MALFLSHTLRAKRGQQSDQCEFNFQNLVPTAGAYKYTKGMDLWGILEILCLYPYIVPLASGPKYLQRRPKAEFTDIWMDGWGIKSFHQVSSYSARI